MRIPVILTLSRAKRKDHNLVIRDPSPSTRIWMTLFALFFPILATAQNAGGTLAGRISDDGDAALDGVVVTATHISTGSTRSAKTAVDGRYRFYSMMTGSYEIVAELPGHISVVVRKIEVSLGTTTGVHVRLRRTAEEEQVTVTAPARFLESTAAIGIVIPREFMADVPLRDRDASELAVVAPFFDATGIGEVMLNGATAATDIPLDAVERINMTSHQHPAEYGRASGGVLRLASIVGAYEYEGDLFALYRNHARGWQWGAAAGGPILKERSHFFAALDGTGKPSRERLFAALDSDVSARHFVHADYRTSRAGDRTESVLLRDLWHPRENLWNDLVVHTASAANEVRESLTGSVITRNVHHDWTAGAVARQNNGRGFFVQDEIVARKFSWHVGLRYEEGFSPRIGAIYDVNGSGRNLVRASFGRYRNPDSDHAALGYSWQVNPWVALNADALRTAPSGEGARNALAVGGRVQFSTVVSVIGSYTFTNVPLGDSTSRHSFAAATIARLPAGFWVSGLGRYRSATEAGPRETDIDLRLAKSFEFGRGYTLDIMLDGFDVFRRGRADGTPAEQVGVRVNF